MVVCGVAVVMNFSERRCFEVSFACRRVTCHWAATAVQATTLAQGSKVLRSEVPSRSIPHAQSFSSKSLWDNAWKGLGKFLRRTSIPQRRENVSLWASP